MKPDKVSSLMFIAHFRSSGQNNQVLIEPKPSPRTLKISCKQFCQWTKCPEAERLLGRHCSPILLFLPYQQCIVFSVYLDIYQQNFPTDNLENLLEIFRPGYINFFPYMEWQKVRENESIHGPSLSRQNIWCMTLFLFTTILSSVKIKYCDNLSVFTAFQAYLHWTVKKLKW